MISIHLDRLVRCMRGNKIFLKCLFLCILAGSIISCGPVNRFTRVKQIPREYAMNYCVKNIKASKDVWFWADPWIVFSDKMGNVSYRKPMGKVEMKELKFMDAFFVIGKMGDWLEMVKYNPELIKGRGLKNRDKVEYYGWINKSDLLLTRNSVTDLNTGLKNKYITILSDTMLMDEPKNYLREDSVFVFKDLDFTKRHTQLPLYEIVYPLKKSADGEKTLISRKPYISPDSLSAEVCGWIDNSLLTSIGQQLHIDLDSFPNDKLKFMDKQKKRELPNMSFFWESHKEMEKISKSLSYNPVQSFMASDSSISFKTGAFASVISKNKNYVLNVNGSPIYHRYMKKIEENLHNVNILFVIDGGESVLEYFPGTINIIQGLQSLFTDKTEFSYRFGSVLSFNEKGNLNEPVLELTDDYVALLNFLSLKNINKERLSPFGNTRNWSALRKAVDLVKEHKDETNLIILVGNIGTNSEWADYILADRIAKSNCRILGFQLYNDNSNGYNNFVSQVTNMIETYAPIISNKKKEYVVYANQLRAKNEFKEVDKNRYCLDFPKRSMTQGWVVFPQKKERLQLDLLTSSIDTLLQQVQSDNKLLINSLYKAFDETGNFRSELDSTLISYFGIKKLDVKPLLGVSSRKPLKSYIPSQRVVFSKDDKQKLNFKLLLSEVEYKNLRSFVDALSNFEIDYKIKVPKRERQQFRKICDCVEEEEFENEIKIPSNVELELPYASTRSVRSGLIKLYYSHLNSGKFCKTSRQRMYMMTLADVHYGITTCPTANPFLKAFKVKDLMDKKIVTDFMLDELIKDFKTKKAGLEKIAGRSFTSNGQTYYWLDGELLP